MGEGSWVGLDVHARSTLACVLDGASGELRQLQRVPWVSEDTVAWLAGLPGPQYSTETNYLRVYMAQIRRKLEPDPARPRYFITEARLGYRFEASPT